MRLGIGILAGIAFGLCGAVASAHPHIFIDSGVEAVFDAQGRVVALRISWAYDDFYSLLMVEDMGLDPDADGSLTPGEQARLTGFDMDWDADYNGDLYVLSAGNPVAMGGPEAVSVAYVEGIITSTHLRQVTEPVAPGADGLVVQIYDSGFYTAYRINAETALTDAPAGCAAEVFEPDLDAADAKLQAVLAEYQGDESIEMEFPAVGANYADEVRITCPAL
jgi:polyphosphate kinase